jgi:hypothetical protein
VRIVLEELGTTSLEVSRKMDEAEYDNPLSLALLRGRCIIYTGCCDKKKEQKYDKLLYDILIIFIFFKK